MATTSHFDPDSRQQAVIGRVFFEGEHPDYGSTTVLLLLLAYDNIPGIKGIAFMRVFHSPGIFQVGQKVIFENLKGYYLTPSGSKYKLDRCGPTFTEYPEPGKLMAGG
jgi:hypothetical protein